MNQQKTVFNLLDSSFQGGIEEMFIKYNQLLKQMGYKVVCIIPPSFKYMEHLNRLEICYEILKIRNYYDFISTLKFNKLINKYQPDYILSHRGRSHSLVKHWYKFFSNQQPKKKIR